MKFFFLFSFIFLFKPVLAQEQDSIGPSGLQTVIVKAYEQRQQLKDVPAAVNFIGADVLNRFSTSSFGQAINTKPGVRLEERSPGSYRLNIRGSSLRSPFGVRNVKVYYNDIPITDPGGTTYLNGLGVYNIASVEILKGPGSSLYGAGTGGVMLIESNKARETNHAYAEYSLGSYHLQNMYASVATGKTESHSQLGFQHQESSGYRNQSTLNRNIISWNGTYSFSDKQILKTSFLYSALDYQTPGGLTKVEYDLDPRLARPRVGSTPSAEESHAAIKQKNFLAGLSFTQELLPFFSNKTVAYAMFTELRNPNIRNYSKNSEPHVGGRSVFTYAKNIGKSKLDIVFGGEIQQGFAVVNVYKNKAGVADTLQTSDDLATRQAMAFTQASVEYKGWELIAGASLNSLLVVLKRSAPFPLATQTRKFSNQIAPRVAISKSWKDVTIYSSLSRGFSPPSSAELSPSGSNINLGLNAETGINNDIGVRGLAFGKLTFDLNAFLFHLESTIVQRRDSSSGDYYINAGKTKQQGIETSLRYPLLQHTSFIRRSYVWASHTWHQFRYEEFKQITTDFSGKHLPGIAPQTFTIGIDFLTQTGFGASINYYYSDKLPLNDANTDYAASYQLLNVKISFQKPLSSFINLLVTTGADNLMDSKYSLGNDINAFGGRYYNAATGRSFYVSAAIGFTHKKSPSS